MMTRRDFIGSAAAAAATTGCVGLREPLGLARGSGFVWGDLLHLGMNMWCDWENPAPLSYGWDETVIRWPSDTVRAEPAVWNDWTAAMAREKLNLAVIDLGEALVYPSHPELAAKGAWTPERMQAEIRRLRGLGIEVIPKLNFSAGHNRWLNEYRFMMSTDRYRQVCAEIIADVAEIFGRPRFFHIGYDEETAGHQSRFQYVVVRQGELWWKDFLSVVDAVEKTGSRAWCFSDKVWRDPKEFLNRMPKSVVQCPWNYRKDEEHPEYVQSVEDLLNAGYDLIPDVGTFTTKGKDLIGKTEGDLLFERFIRGDYPQKQLLGFLLCSWARPVAYHRNKGLLSIEYFGDMKRRWEASRQSAGTRLGKAEA